MGRSIAAELAKRLDVEYVDRDIVEETARRMGQPVSEISNSEEVGIGQFLRRAFPLGEKIGLRDSIFEVQKNIIRDFAKEQSGIVVGRCADYILRDHPRVLSVFIYAPVEERLNNCVTRLGMDEKEARRMIAEVDNAREQYHKNYIPGYKNPFSGRDLCIDSSTFGVEGSAEILEHIVREKFYG